MARPKLIRVTFYGAVAGLLAGVAVLAFRWFIEIGQVWFLPGGEVGNYENLEPLTRFLLPVTGALVLGWIFERLQPSVRQVGILHVLSNLRSPAGGRLPVRNALVQFFFGAAAIVTGHSVDREGPGVHLGSTCGSFLGERFGLSNRDRRTLIACGAAASVAAAFNTPLAGAIFAIEVMRFRYNIARFMPVIMAAVIGAVAVRALRGPAPSFVVPSAGMQSAFELPAIALLGLATGALAGVFTRACALFAVHFFTFRPLVAFLVTGTVTGVLAQAVPQIMGVGHDILEAMLTRELAAPLLLGIVSCKILATSVAVGCRLPGGLIGPSLVIGGAMGSLLHFMLGGILHEGMASPGFYAIIGMAAMMGATLQAPLAALIALLELTGMPGIILPGMLAMVAADAVCRLFMGRESVFVALLRAFRSTADRDAGRLV